MEKFMQNMSDKLELIAIGLREELDTGDVNIAVNSWVNQNGLGCVFLVYHLPPQNRDSQDDAIEATIDVKKNSGNEGTTLQVQYDIVWNDGRIIEQVGKMEFNIQESGVYEEFTTTIATQLEPRLKKLVQKYQLRE